MVMAMSVFVGGENFDELRRRGCYYVDKTELLYELVNNTDNIVTLFTRPRRFGKTLTMRMMESFFDIRRDSRAVFDGLAIMEHEEFCTEWMNQYPVLFLTFKGVEDLSFEEAYKTLQVKLSDVCKTHEKLLESDKLNGDDKTVFQKLMDKKAELAEIKDSLKMLMRMMSVVYEKPVILLMDEYDAHQSVNRIRKRISIMQRC